MQQRRRPRQHMLKTNPQELVMWNLQGPNWILGVPDAGYEKQSRPLFSTWSSYFLCPSPLKIIRVLRVPQERNFPSISRTICTPMFAIWPAQHVSSRTEAEHTHDTNVAQKGTCGHTRAH
eukprot:1007770-Amphidinium_carterae.1